MITFENKRILITGAANGIGKDLAEKMAAAGGQLFLLDQDAAALGKLKESLSRQNCNSAEIYPGDITEDQYVRGTIENIVQRHSELDHVIHCAGIYPTSMMAETSDELWHKVMSVNTESTFLLCRAAVPHLSDRSSIVAITSLAGHRGNYAHSHYAASKGAVASFCKSIALELAPRTRVNVVAPGMIQTQMTEKILSSLAPSLQETTPMKRIGRPEDVANVVIFLCSDLAAFVTGQTIHVNGGLYIV